MIRFARPRWLLLVLVAIILRADTHSSHAQVDSPRAKTTEEAPEPLVEFRRVFVPADSPDQWPRGKTPYLPMRSEEFEQLVRRISGAGSTDDPMTQPRVASAIYYARLEGDRLVGSASVNVTRDSDGLDFMRFSPLGTSVTDVHWDGSKRRRAYLGTSRHGAMLLRVEKPGTLNFDWKERPGSQEGDGSRFQFAWPKSPSTTMIVDLPLKYTLKCSQGIVAIQKKADEANRDSNVPKISSGYRRWSVALGSRNSGELLITAAAAEPDQVPATIVQDNQYQISPQGLLLISTLRPVAHSSVDRLRVKVDSGLQPIYARHGGRDVRWSVPDENKSSGVMEIELSQAISGRGQEVTIGAIGPIQTESRWQLPSMHVQDLGWQAGQTSIVLTPPLSVRRIVPHNCNLTSPIVDGTLELRQHSADASVVLDIGKRTQKLKATTGTTIDIGPREIVGQGVALLTLDQESGFEVSLKVRPGWNIVSVASPDVPVRVPNVPARENETIQVLLDEPLTEGQRLRLEFTGQRNWPGSRRHLVVDDLAMIEPIGHANSTELLLLRAKPPYQLKSQGSDRLTPLARDTLDVESASLFEEGSSGLLIACDENSSFLQLELGSTGANYSADVAQQVAVNDQWLTETYRIKINPDASGSSPIQRVRVLFAPGRAGPLHWSLKGRVEEELGARRIRSSRRDTTDEKSDGAELWEITLPQPQRQPFELKAVRATSFEKDAPISLASVIDATNQTGTVRIASNDRMIGVHNSGLTPTSVPAGDSKSSGVMLSFVYDPKTTVLDRNSASLKISVSDNGESPPLAWVVNLSLEARFIPPDGVLYTATYVIRSGTGGVASIICPLGSVVRSVRVDGRDVAKTGVYESAGSDAERTLLIPLRDSSQNTLVSVDYSTTAQGGGFWDRWIPEIEPLFPEIDMPVVARDWVLWLPPEYSVVSAKNVGPRSAWAPPSISQRLFGPLARSNQQAAFDPFDEDSWRAPFRTASLGDRRKAELLLENLETSESNDTNPARTLGEKLQRYVEQQREVGEEDSPARPETRLLVDTFALRTLGLSPSTTIQQQSGHRSLGHWLEEHGLCLMAHEEAVVLTTRRRVSLYQDQLEWCSPLPVYSVGVNPLGEAIESSDSGGDQSTWLMPASAWIFASDQFDSLAVGKESRIAEGWRMVIPTSGPGQATAGIRVIRTADVAMWSWFVLILTASLAWWKSLAFPRVALLLGAGFAIGALLLPMGVSPIATAGFGGVCLGTLFRVTPRLAHSAAATWRPAKETTRSESKVGSIAQATVWILLASLVALLLLSSSVFAQGVTDSDKSHPSVPVDRVLIPIDKDEKPTGDHYFVPESLYERLRLLGGKSSVDQLSWLIESAVYRAELRRRPGAGGLTAGMFHGHFTIEALESGTQVQLPFKRGEVEFVEGKSFVNDRPSAIEWNSDGSAIRLELEEAGRYRLHLQWQLKPKKDEKDGQVDIAVPLTPNSRFEIVRPTRTTKVNVETAAGDMEFASEGTSVEGDLGPLGRLKFRWEGATRAGQQQTVFDSDEMSWMKVQPATVTVATKFRITVEQGQIRTLTIVCDPRLSLYPFEDGSPIEKVESDLKPDRSIYRLTLRRSASDELAFTARFLMKGTSAVGSLDMPKVRLEGARRSRKWFATSVDPSHLAEERPKSGLSADLSEFVRLWGSDASDNAADKILSAYRLTNDHPQWTLLVRPKAAPAEVESQVEFVFDQRWVNVEFQAVIQNRVGYRMQYVLRVPHNVQIDRIESVTKNGPVKVRWHRSGGWVTCFFNEPQKSKTTLRLTGRMPAELGKEMTITDFGLEGENTKAVIARVFRHESVEVSVLKVDSLLPSSTVPVRSLADENRRLVASYEGNGRPFRISTKTVSNEWKSEAATVTSLRREKGSWQWELAGQVDVNAGILDRIVLELPKSCDGPFELVSSMVDGPAVSAALSSDTNGDSLRIVIRPERPARSQWRFRLKGTLATQGQIVRAPRVSVLAVDRHREFLRLPDGGAGWETAGLPQAGDAPPWMSPLDSDPLLFDLTARNSSAVRKAGSGQSVRPTIILADILVGIRTDSTCHGIVKFDLYPAGRASCELRTPNNIELVYATIDGRVAAVTPKDSTTWEIPLTSDLLPQSVEVVFRGKLSPRPVAGARLVLDSPWLHSEDSPLEANRTLWTVGPLSELEISAETPLADDSVDPRKLDAVRAEAMVIALRGAMGKAVPDGWASAWVARHTRYLDSIDSPPPVDTLIDTQLAAWLLSVGVATPAEIADRPRDLRTTMSDRILYDADDVYAGRARSWEFEQRQQELSVSLTARSAAEKPETTAWAIAIALLAIAACIGVSRTPRSRLERRVRSVWMRGRYAIMVAVGIVWWMWLWPSFLGLVVVLLAIILAFRPVREFAPELPHGSTVMRRANLDR